jgi:hypothetical protein
MAKTMADLEKEVNDKRLDLDETQAEYDDLKARDAFDHPCDESIYEKMITEKTLDFAKHDLALRELKRRLAAGDKKAAS